MKKSTPKLKPCTIKDIPDEYVQYVLFGIHPSKKDEFNFVTFLKNFSKSDPFEFSFSNLNGKTIPLEPDQHFLNIIVENDDRTNILGMVDGKIILTYTGIFGEFQILECVSSHVVEKVMNHIREIPKLKALIKDRSKRKVKKLFHKSCELCQTVMDERLDVMLCDSIDHSVICQKCVDKSFCAFCGKQCCLICNQNDAIDPELVNIIHFKHKDQLFEDCVCKYSYCLDCVSQCSECNTLIEKTRSKCSECIADE